MAQTNLLKSTSELQTDVKRLLERLTLTQSAAGELLVAVRQSEGELIEREEAVRREREERERMERLHEMLVSDKDVAVHVGGIDEETAPTAEAGPTPAAEPKAAEPAEAAEPEKPEPQKTEPQKADPIAEAPVPEAPKKPQGGYEARVIAPEDDRRRPPQQRDSYAPRTGGQQGGYAPRTGGQQGGYAPRTDGQQGGYAPRTGGQQGGYAPRTGGQQGGYAPRAGGQGGYAPRTGGQGQQGGYAPRTGGQQGGYAPRTGGQGQQGGYAPRTGGQGQQGGFAPRAGAPGRGPATPAAPAAGGKERVSNYDPNKSAYTRTHEADRKSKNKKTIARETAPSAKNWEEDGLTGNRRPKRGGKQPVRRPEPVVIEKAVIATETITVKELSEKIGKPAAGIIKKLFMLGTPRTINEEIDFDTCELIASDFGIELELRIAKSYEEVLTDSADDADAPELLEPRSPIVTIMGHVDHGKTSLLDAIRDSSVTEGEAGGITQHIGAYTVSCNGRQITFIDTPGHEAFTSMRARGAQVTDIVILVVAADDGIMPQTVEAINHAKAAGVPLIVAINKMDRPEANPERVKQQLTEYELVSEEWGGQTIIVPVSAKTRMGIDSLLEMVLLQADVLELKANSNRLAKGTIIEAKLDKGRGPIATVLVQNGTLRRGDTIVAGTAYGKVRGMVDDRGRAVNEAGPSTPVEVLGFNEVPEAGDILNVAEADKLSRQVAEERRDKIKAAQLKSKSRVSLDELFTQMAEDALKELNIIVKADVQGSVEAVKQALEKLSNDEVRVRCIHGGVGAITGTDVMFASASNAIVIGFNVRPDAGARTLAERENVDVRTYRVIYNAIDDVTNAMKGMFKPVFKEVELGRATVREVFKVSGVGTIAGSYVNDGKITRSAQVRIVRDGVVIHEGKIASLRRFKDDAREVATGFECGIGIENYNDINVGDVIEAYVIEEVKRT